MIISFISPATSSPAFLPVSVNIERLCLRSMRFTSTNEVILSSILPSIKPRIGEANVVALSRCASSSILKLLFSSTSSTLFSSINDLTRWVPLYVVNLNNRSCSHRPAMKPTNDFVIHGIFATEAFSEIPGTEKWFVCTQV